MRKDSPSLRASSVVRSTDPRECNISSVAGEILPTLPSTNESHHANPSASPPDSGTGLTSSSINRVRESEMEGTTAATWTRKARSVANESRTPNPVEEEEGVRLRSASNTRWTWER